MAKCEFLYEQDEPFIYATIKAMHKMRYYIDHTDMEIGWLGYVTKLDKDTYLIEDVFLLKQKVHSATTEIDPDALASLATNLIKQGNEGIALYNKIRMWGHSHVNMGTSPSGQDDNQMDEFATSDFYIRLIGNKSGDWNVCLYDYENNVVWSGLQLQLYYEVDITNEELDKEIQDNVSKIVSATPVGKTGFSWIDNRNKYWDGIEEDWYDRYYNRSTKSQAERLREEKESETKEEEGTTSTEEIDEEIPYEIAGEVTKADLRHMKRYYSSDKDTCFFICTADRVEVENMIYMDYGCILPDDIYQDFVTDMENIYNSRYGM